MSLIDSAKDKKFLIRCSYIEIYNEEIRDLLSANTKSKLDLKENSDKGNFLFPRRFHQRFKHDELQIHKRNGNLYGNW